MGAMSSRDAVQLSCLPEESVRAVEARKGLFWWLGVALCAGLALYGLGWSAWRLASEGVGLLGVNNDVPWGWDIVNFVFWIGIGHAGTLISSVLLLTHQGWRTPIARAAELMTICAVVCAGIFPLVHVGRIWVVWMVSPFPDASGVFPDIGSALVWDVLAVGTYFCLSLLYWWIGMIPDLALMRDRCASWRLKRFYGTLACGWRGTGRQWAVFRRANVAMACVLAPLVVTVHSVVSCDFATTVKPGWHETMFPPMFVAGAILSGMAMVQLVALFDRGVRLRAVSVQQVMSRFVLGFSWMMAVFYAVEAGMAMLEGGAVAEVMEQRVCGEYAWWFWAMLAGNVLVPQLYWVKRWRSNPAVVVAVSVAVLFGMWLERVVIVVGSSLVSFLPGQEGGYVPSATDWWMLVGSVGLFVCLYALLGRRMPPEFGLHGDGSPAVRRQAWKAWIPAAGAAFGMAVVLAWIWLTQDCATSAVVQGRAPGWERWVDFVPAVFVGGLLGAGLWAVAGFFACSGLPRWYHPDFNE